MTAALHMTHTPARPTTPPPVGALTLTTTRIGPRWWRGRGRRGVYFARSQAELLRKIADHEPLSARARDLTTTDRSTAA